MGHGAAREASLGVAFQEVWKVRGGGVGVGLSQSLKGVLVFAVRRGWETGVGPWLRTGDSRGTNKGTNRRGASCNRANARHGKDALFPLAIACQHSLAHSA